MALASNTKEQLAKKLKSDIEQREPSFTVAQSSMASGDPMLTIKNASGTVLAVAAMTRRTFNGFNVVAELSSSAAEGLPEHITWLAMDSGLSQLLTAKLAMYAKNMGTSSMKMIFISGPVEGSLIDANVSAEIPNDGRYGASGQ